MKATIIFQQLYMQTQVLNVLQNNEINSTFVVFSFFQPWLFCLHRGAELYMAVKNEPTVSKNVKGANILFGSQKVNSVRQIQFNWCNSLQTSLVLRYRKGPVCVKVDLHSCGLKAEAGCCHQLFFFFFFKVFICSNVAGFPSSKSAHLKTKMLNAPVILSQ